MMAIQPEDICGAADVEPRPCVCRLQTVFSSRPYERWAWELTARWEEPATPPLLDERWAFGWSCWSTRGPLYSLDCPSTAGVQLAELAVIRPTPAGPRGQIRRARARATRRPIPMVIGDLTRPVAVSTVTSAGAGLVVGLAAGPAAAAIGISPLWTVAAGVTAAVGGWQTWRWTGTADRRLWTPRAEHADDQLRALTAIAALRKRAAEIPTLRGYLDLTGRLHEAAWQVLNPDVRPGRLGDIDGQIRQLSAAVDELAAALAVVGDPASTADDSTPEHPAPTAEELTERVTARAAALREIGQLTDDIVGQNPRSDP